MKRFLFPCTLALMALMFLTSGMMDNNGQAGRTGSPGELTCRDGCHNSFVLNSGPGTIALGSTNMTGWEYEPGTTYHMTLTVAQTGVNLFGLGVEALTSTNTNAGMLNVTDAVATQIKFATVSGVSRRNVVHKLNGGAGSGSKTFTFDWQAPVTDVGAVTFYFAGNAANGMNNTSGDHIYTGNQVITPAIGTGVADRDRDRGVLLWPNPASGPVTLAYDVEEAGPVQADLFNVEGRFIAALLRADRAAGRHVEALGDLSYLPEGIYHLRLRINGTDRLLRVVRMAH